MTVNAFLAEWSEARHSGDICMWCVGNSDIRKKERVYVYARCDLESESATLSCGGELHYKAQSYPSIHRTEGDSESHVNGCRSSYRIIIQNEPIVNLKSLSCE